jgi:drug/metabolite transporter (DMT)-like permease
MERSRTEVPHSAHALRGTVLVLLSAACFGSLSTLVKLAMRSDATLLHLMALRFVIGAALLLLLAVGASSFRAVKVKSSLVPLVLLGGVMQAGITFLSLASLRWLTPSALAFLFFTYPVWVALLSAALREERLTGARALALALAFGGVATMVGVPSAGKMPLPGVLMALGAAVTYAVYVRLIQRYQAGVPAVAASAAIASGCALVFVVASAREGSLLSPLAIPTWGLVAVLAVVCTLAAFFLFVRGIEILGPVRTAIVGTVEPFFTTLLAAAVLGDAVRPAALLGGTLVVAGVVVQRVLDSGQRTARARAG